MRVVETRELDGPNMFLAEPAIKIEFAFESERDVAWARDRAIARLGANGFNPSASGSIGETITFALKLLSGKLGASVPASVWRTLDTRGHLAFAFGWSSRAQATYIANALIALFGPDASETWPESDFVPSDHDSGPQWLRDRDRRARIVAVTGTNGKTTTTRLIAHLAMNAGLHAGWSSSSGVYIDGTQVMSGDYSGPSGARRVLEDPSVDVAVLESARGGILLRGLAFESSDVSVFTNISADHLGLQGIATVESLANVKAVVARSTKADGWAVLNADDPHVMRATESIRAQKFLVSQNDANPVVARHLGQGGQALLATGDDFVLARGGDRTLLMPIADAPITFGGRARHMVENAMCAAAAGVALGFTFDQVAAGLRSFRNSPDQNLGRMNLFAVDGATVVLDFAHNSSGLAHLMAFAKALRAENGQIIAIVGTAGDREASVLREIGRIAASESSLIIIKETEKYLRGRTNQEMIDLFNEGIALSRQSPEVLISPTEADALETAISRAESGDVVAVMCHEQMSELAARLSEVGRQIDV